MIYRYEAKDEGGKTVSGTLEAETEQSAANLVRQMGYFPMRFRTDGRGGAAMLDTPLRPTSLTDRTIQQGLVFDRTYAQPFSSKPYGNWVQRNLIFPLSNGVSSKDLAIFYREFATMVKAGVPITRCLESMVQTHPAGSLSVAIRRIKARVEAGDTLSNAFGEFPHLFTDLHRAMIAAGEESGSIDTMFMRISDYLENEFTLREMIKRETFMTKLEIVAAIFLPPLYIWVTQGWGAYYHQVVQPAIGLAALVLMLFCAIRIALKNDYFRRGYDTVKAFIPWFGGTIRMLALAKFARAFASLYAAGVLIPRALTISARVTGNAYFSAKIARAVDFLMNGGTVSQALSSTGAFPPIFISMVNTGETTGSLDEMLSKVADFYEDESRTRLHTSVKALGVLLLIIMGIVTCIAGMKALGVYINGLQGLMNN
jgi:type IV pilus assembly protein PilC